MMGDKMTVPEILRNNCGPDGCSEHPDIPCDLHGAADHIEQLETEKKELKQQITRMVSIGQGESKGWTFCRLCQSQYDTYGIERHKLINGKPCPCELKTTKQSIVIENEILKGRRDAAVELLGELYRKCYHDKTKNQHLSTHDYQDLFKMIDEFIKASRPDG